LSHIKRAHLRRGLPFHFDFITLIRGYLCKSFYYVHICDCAISWLLGERGLPPHIFASDVCRLPLYRRAGEDQCGLLESSSCRVQRHAGQRGHLTSLLGGLQGRPPRTTQVSRSAVPLALRKHNQLLMCSIRNAEPSAVLIRLSPHGAPSVALALHLTVVLPAQHPPL
jgi:hypothetical protein